MKEEKEYFVKIGDNYVSDFSKPNGYDIEKIELCVNKKSACDLRKETAQKIVNRFGGKIYERTILYGDYKEIEE